MKKDNNKVCRKGNNKEDKIENNKEKKENKNNIENKKVWRLINRMEVNGSMQMAIDEAILNARINNFVPNTLRFFTWDPICLTIGYFQSFEKEVNVDEVREQGIDVVRRYTGGGAVLHDKELTYSLAICEDDISYDIIKSYETICGAVIEGLKLLNIDSQFHPINDILVNNKKISGNAQTRKNGVALQHGTILLDVDVKKMFSLLKVSDEKIKDKMIKSVEERITCLKNEMKREVKVEDLEIALLKGFEKAFDITFEKSDLTEYELDLAKKLCEEKYSNPKWNYSR